MQVQRGLGASNLAIASVGGTLNIITDIARQQRGWKIKQEAGNNAFYKTTLNFSSGLINKKTAFTLGMARKSGEGLPAQAWSSAWAYFGALSFWPPTHTKLICLSPALRNATGTVSTSNPLQPLMPITPNP